MVVAFAGVVVLHQTQNSFAGVDFAEVAFGGVDVCVVDIESDTIPDRFVQ